MHSTGEVGRQGKGCIGPWLGKVVPRPLLLAGCTPILRDGNNKNVRLEAYSAFVNCHKMEGNQVSQLR
jgi:hypothetical protein